MPEQPGNRKIPEKQQVRIIIWPGIPARQQPDLKVPLLLMVLPLIMPEQKIIKESIIKEQIEEFSIKTRRQRQLLTLPARPPAGRLAEGREKLRRRPE